MWVSAMQIVETISSTRRPYLSTRIVENDVPTIWELTTKIEAIPGSKFIPASMKIVVVYWRTALIPVNWKKKNCVRIMKKAFLVAFSFKCWTKDNSCESLLLCCLSSLSSSSQLCFDPRSNCIDFSASAVLLLLIYWKENKTKVVKKL